MVSHLPILPFFKEGVKNYKYMYAKGEGVDRLTANVGEQVENFFYNAHKSGESAKQAK